MVSSADIIAALANWSHDETPLLEVFESREVEFKKTSYPLDTDKGKAEFAKNIAGMANGGGGVIVLGVETQRDVATGRDKSIGVKPLASGSTNVQQMEAVARSWLCPPQRDLEIREWPRSDGAILVSIRALRPAK